MDVSSDDQAVIPTVGFIHGSGEDSWTTKVVIDIDEYEKACRLIEELRLEVSRQARELSSGRFHDD